MSTTPTVRFQDVVFLRSQFPTLDSAVVDDVIHTVGISDAPIVLAEMAIHTSTVAASSPTTTSRAGTTENPSFSSSTSFEDQQPHQRNSTGDTVTVRAPSLNNISPPNTNYVSEDHTTSSSSYATPGDGDGMITGSCTMCTTLLYFPMTASEGVVKCHTCGHDFDIRAFLTRENSTVVLRVLTNSDISLHKSSTAIKVKLHESLLCSFPVLCEKLGMEGMDPYELYNPNNDEVYNVEKTPAEYGLKTGSVIRLRPKRSNYSPSADSLHGHCFHEHSLLKPHKCFVCEKSAWGRHVKICQNCGCACHGGCISSISVFCEATTAAASKQLDEEDLTVPSNANNHDTVT
eukprot:TRINITY_DN67251_c11_g4_i1.p1 TRINITY_DN67251_c11_g4~~TRINITY_DN67251_c11_g4_i1.p1  ORF type:complete len:346 (+),score=8.06 TRINITY_DN67251_c11_g4_i1:74-1111(+)